MSIPELTREQELAVARRKDEIFAALAAGHYDPLVEYQVRSDMPVDRWLAYMKLLRDRGQGYAKARSGDLQMVWQAALAIYEKQHSAESLRTATFEAESAFNELAKRLGDW